MARKKLPPPNGHGGPRDGAGRPSTGRQAYTIRMYPATHEHLTLLAQAKNQSIGEFLEFRYPGKKGNV